MQTDNQIKPEARTESDSACSLHGVVELPPVTFAEHKEQTANDCEQVAKMLTDLAQQVRDGNLKAFESWWIEGGTEEGDAKIKSIRERIVLRYLYREERQTNK